MHLRHYTDWTDVAELAAQWDQLAAGNPFRSWAWLGSWWDAYGASSSLEPFVLAVWEDQQLVGLVPCCRETTGAQGNVVRWLGSGEVCSDYVGVIAATGWDEQVADACADWFQQREHRTAWDLVHLEGIDPTDTTTVRFIEAMKERDYLTDARDGMNCWRIDLPSSWDELLARMSKSHRKQIRRVERRMLDNGSARLHTSSDRKDLVRAMPILVDLHQRRRQTLGQPGCFASKRFDDFLHQAAFRLLDDERLRLHWITIDDKPVAAEFQMVGGGVVYCYQAGLDPHAMDVEPGRLIMTATIRQAIEQGYAGIDFLRGDEPYKSHWRAEAHPTLDVRIVSRRALARIRHGVWKMGDTIKHWLKTRIKKKAPTTSE